MTDKEVMQQALEALEFDRFTPEDLTHRYYTKKAITALKAALEQQAEPPPEWPLIKNILAVFGLDAIAFVAKWQAAQQAEPVAVDDLVAEFESTPEGAEAMRQGRDWLEAGQPEQVDCPRCGHVCSQRQWVGLTPEEILDMFDINNVYGSKWIEFARTVEAKLKAKNDH